MGYVVQCTPNNPLTLRHPASLGLQIVADAREPLSKALDILDKHLEGKQFFVGDQFTVADISFVRPFFVVLASLRNDCSHYVTTSLARRSRTLST